MSSSSAKSRGFFAYYREYARSGVHAASAAALTAFGLLATYTGNRGFILLAIAVYVLPPAFLYLTGEGERVPTVVGDGDQSGGNRGDGATREVDPGDEDRSSSVDADAEGGTDDRHQVDDTDTAPPEAENGANRGTDRQTGADATEPNHHEVSSSGESLADDIGTDDASRDEDGWSTVETPTDEPLTGVVATHDGAFAVGENGVVLARETDGWEFALEHGPSADGESLRGVDATDDDQTIWFAGDGGALGRYDIEEGRLTDHSAPKDQTSTWTAVAVVGSAGEERVHLANGSGEVLRGAYDGGAVDWDEIRKPGSGSSITDLAFDDAGYACDSSQGVYATTDGGASYETIGIEDANTDFAALAATDAELVVAGGDGTVFRYDGSVWTTLRAGETALRAIDLANEMGLAAGDAGGIFEHADGGWESVETPTDADLSGVLVGAGERDRPDVAVGTSGTIVERDRD
ncbi:MULTISPECIES: WD40/YVTN/BNR-like repeat-containing protein [Halococcus]|uniref:Photosynthesis system II assembly factor Ycf48/Hcf136-like domain-containing protein n=1 Tax=Halococcus salifodinae DSM 8989 TaxID=1227456 RepID=M0N705_9EURY|nr:MULTISPECIES: hypothetical protein [Halococcus]EMA52455.1 hypothetical protein C450_10158 [Halococcus salifodinae DSM 8989]